MPPLTNFFLFLPYYVDMLKHSASGPTWLLGSKHFIKQDGNAKLSHKKKLINTKKKISKIKRTDMIF